MMPRPRGFSAIETRFHAALQSGELPHAWLLHGPSGIGKALLARALAGDCLCRRRDEQGRACGACQDCRLMQAGTHPDFSSLRRAQEEKKDRLRRDITIDQVRALGERLCLSTHADMGYRVAVIDAIDECNAQAANALLKTLEEPLPGTLLLLVCHDLRRVLPTLRSRCVLQACAPLSEEDCQAVLRAFGIADAHLPQAVAWADGRPGLLRALAQQEAMREALRLHAMVTSLAGQDLAELRDFLRSCHALLPASLLARIVFCALRSRLARPSMDFHAWEGLWAAMREVLRWPEDVRRHALRPEPALFARMLRLREGVRRLDAWEREQAG